MLRIIVVDDHLMLIQGIKKLLETRSGLQVVGEAYDGREGVELVKRLKPDIAIVDITMPGLNGLDATRAIAKISPRTKTIARRSSGAGRHPAPASANAPEWN